jgi:hypothetical protein
MGFKKTLIRALLDRLPVEEQERMAADVVAWLCAELPSFQRQEKIEKLAPRLLKRIRAGQLGLRLVAYYHLSRLPPLCWLDPRRAAAQDPGKDHLIWLICRWY